MAEITIPWPDEPLTAVLPPEWSVQQIAEGNIPSAGDHWGDDLAAALARPEGTPPLGKLLAARRGGKIVLIVEDLTRHSPLPAILEVVFRELAHAQIPDEDVEIVFATGMHPPLTGAEAAGKIGADLARRVAWRSNPWRDRDAHVHLGVADPGGGGGIDVWIDRGVARADLRIVVTAVSPHLQAGFGGGYKMFVPGCAHQETIRQLHSSSVPRRATQQVGQPASANRMRRMIEAAGRTLDAAGGATFGIQYVQDTADRPAAIAVGDIFACHRMLAKKCAAAYGVVVGAPADVVIANAWPRDLDLWQSFKAIANTCWAARKNGVLICVTRCPAGANMPTFRLPVPPRYVRRAVRLLGPGALAAMLTRLVPKLAADASFFIRIALQVLHRNTVLMVAPTLAARGEGMLGLEVLADLDQAIAAAAQRVGAGPKRVIVFPAGGVSYPILRPAAPGAGQG